MTALQRTKTWQTIPLTIVVCLACIPAQAKYGGGRGTAEDPYQIWTAEHMNAIGAEPNDLGKHFKLMANIDLSAYEGDSFNLIGYSDDSKRITYSFWGLFDGNGHTLSNLTYIIEGPDPRDESPSWLRAYGIFRYLSGEVRDLGLINPTIRPSATCSYRVGQMGALAGYCLRGSITNCYVQGGHISGDSTVGGLVGILGSSSSSTTYAATVSDCSASCTVSCSLEDHPAAGPPGAVSAAFGGLVGSSQGTILHSYAHGNVEAAGVDSVGGLVGHLQCNGTVEACLATGRVSGGNAVGGLAGFTDANSVIQASYCTGPVSGATRVGGLVGRARRESTIRDCYSRGSVSGQERVGGLVGEVEYGSWLERSYATGAVLGSLKTGGLIGHQPERLALSDCFWDLETSGLDDSDGGIALSTAEMQDWHTYINATWDFVDESANGTEDLWQMRPDASTYPQLAWEPLSEPVLIFDLNENPGWTTEGQWQFGQPAGQGGSEHGNPDPSSGYTGDNVYGVNLDGDYSLLDADPRYLTCGPLDCRAYHHILLQFARWLNTDQADFVKATVEVSDDGSTWHTVWEWADTEAELVDDAWWLVTYDISCWADQRPTVYLRWGYHVMYPDAWQFSGWNIDDVTLLGVG